MGRLLAAQGSGGLGFGPGFSTHVQRDSGRVLLWGGHPRGCHRHLVPGVGLEEEYILKPPSPGRSAILPHI